MFKNITKELKFCYTDLLQMLFLPIGAWIFGEIITAVIIVASNEDSYFTVGGIVALSLTGIVLLILPTMQILINFSLCVSMARTRKQYLIGISLTIMLEAIAMIIVALIMSNLSYIIKAVFYSNLPVEEQFSGIISMQLALNYIWLLAVVPIAVTTVGLAVSALFKRYSSKVLWVIWAIYMVLVLSLSSNLERIFNIPIINTIISTVFSLPPAIPITIAIAIWLIVLFFSVKSLLKASV